MDINIICIFCFITGFLLLNVCAIDIKTSHFTDEWAVEIKGGIENVRKLATEYGFILVDTIMEDYYTLRHSRVSKRSKYPSKFYHRTLAQDSKVLWLEQQVAKKRVKRFVPYQQFNDQKWPSQWYLALGFRIYGSPGRTGTVSDAN